MKVQYWVEVVPGCYTTNSVIKPYVSPEPFTYKKYDDNTKRYTFTLDFPELEGYEEQKVELQEVQ